MNRFHYLLILLLFTSTISRGDPAPADDHAADRTALRALGTRYEEAINSGNVTGLAPFIAPSPSAVFATNEEKRSIDEFQKYFDSIKQRLGKNSSYTVKLQPDRTEFFGDIALAHGRSDETAVSHGRKYHFITHWTAILKKDADGWKALRLHVSMDPFDNAVIAMRLRIRTWLMTAAGVLAMGGAFVLGRITKKRHS